MIFPRSVGMTVPRSGMNIPWSAAPIRVRVAERTVPHRTGRAGFWHEGFRDPMARLPLELSLVANT